MQILIFMYTDNLKIIFLVVPSNFVAYLKGVRQIDWFRCIP